MSGITLSGDGAAAWVGFGKRMLARLRLRGQQFGRNYIKQKFFIGPVTITVVYRLVVGRDDSYIDISVVDNAGWTTYGSFPATITLPAWVGRSGKATPLAWFTGNFIPSKSQVAQIVQEAAGVVRYWYAKLSIATQLTATYILNYSGNRFLAHVKDATSTGKTAELKGSLRVVTVTPTIPTDPLNPFTNVDNSYPYTGSAAFNAFLNTIGVISTRAGGTDSLAVTSTSVGGLILNHSNAGNSFRLALDQWGARYVGVVYTVHYALSVGVPYAVSGGTQIDIVLRSVTYLLRVDMAGAYTEILNLSEDLTFSLAFNGSGTWTGYVFPAGVASSAALASNTGGGFSIPGVLSDLGFTAAGQVVLLKGHNKFPVPNSQLKVYLDGVLRYAIDSTATETFGFGSQPVVTDTGDLTAILTSSLVFWWLRNGALTSYGIGGAMALSKDGHYALRWKDDDTLTLYRDGVVIAVQSVSPVFGPRNIISNYDAPFGFAVQVLDFVTGVYNVREITFTADANGVVIGFGFATDWEPEIRTGQPQPQPAAIGVTPFYSLPAQASIA